MNGIFSSLSHIMLSSAVSKNEYWVWLSPPHQVLECNLQYLLCHTYFKGQQEKKAPSENYCHYIVTELTILCPLLPSPLCYSAAGPVFSPPRSVADTPGCPNPIPTHIGLEYKLVFKHESMWLLEGKFCLTVPAEVLWMVLRRLPQRVWIP